MRFSVLVGSIVVAAAAGGCSGSTNTTMPSQTSAMTIDIVSSDGRANLGSQSFSPNPASESQGGMVAWHNSDSTTHHIVMDDGSLDTGDIAPGTSGPARMLSVSRGTYHCTIHPTMVGSINMATPMPTPGPGY